MTLNKSFVVYNGLTVETTDVINSSGDWVGPGTNITGNQGPQGFIGDNGLEGPQGGTGPTGFPGANGAQGPQGGTGPTGFQGPQGTAGPSGSGGATTISAIGVNTPAGVAGEIRATGDITAFYSDKRLKKNIEIIDNCLEKIISMSGIYFTQNKLAEKFGYNDYKKHIGLIAQQVKPFAPEIVKLAPFDIDENGASKSGENYLTVQYEKLIPIIIQAIKEQQQELKSILQKIESN